MIPASRNIPHRPAHDAFGSALKLLFSFSLLNLVQHFLIPKTPTTCLWWLASPCTWPPSILSIILVWGLLSSWTDREPCHRTTDRTRGSYALGIQYLHLLRASYHIHSGFTWVLQIWTLVLTPQNYFLNIILGVLGIIINFDVLWKT